MPRDYRLYLNDILQAIGNIREYANPQLLKSHIERTSGDSPQTSHTER